MHILISDYDIMLKKKLVQLKIMITTSFCVNWLVRHYQVLFITSASLFFVSIVNILHIWKESRNNKNNLLEVSLFLFYYVKIDKMLATYTICLISTRKYKWMTKHTRGSPWRVEIILFFNTFPLQCPLFNDKQPVGIEKSIKEHAHIIKWPILISVGCWYGEFCVDASGFHSL